MVFKNGINRKIESVETSLPLHARCTRRNDKVEPTEFCNIIIYRPYYKIMAIDIG